MNESSAPAGQWLNWMIDESLSLRWAGFKLNSASIELQLIVLPAPSPLRPPPRPPRSSSRLSPFQHSITFHLHQSVFFLFFTPTAAYLRHLYLSTPFLLSICLALSCRPSHALTHVIYGSIRPSLFLSLESDGAFAHTHKNAQSASRFMCLCLALRFPIFLFFSFLAAVSVQFLTISLSRCFPPGS